MKRICITLSKERAAGGKTCQLLCEKKDFVSEESVSCLRLKKDHQKTQSCSMKNLWAGDTQKLDTQIHLPWEEQTHIWFPEERSLAFASCWSPNFPKDHLAKDERKNLSVTEKAEGFVVTAINTSQYQKKYLWYIPRK